MLARSAPSDEEKGRGVHKAQPGPPILEHHVLDEEQIFARATDYVHYNIGRMTLRDLPAFDNSALFGITVEDENANLREEIRKLTSFASRAEEPELFDSFGAFDLTDATGFRDLSDIAFQLSSAIQIIRHDSAALFLSHYLEESCYNVLKRARTQVRNAFLNRPAGITGHQPRILEDERRNMLAYHGLLDYVLHSIAWWVVRVTELSSYAGEYLAVLARWSVKLKVIALDPTRWAEDSLARAEDELRRISNDQSNEDLIKVDFTSGELDCDKKAVVFPIDYDMDFLYYEAKFSLREQMHQLVEKVLSSVGTRYTTDGEGAIEVRTLLRRGGLDDSPRHFTIYGNGEIETSSELADMRRSYPALRRLLALSRKIAMVAKEPPSMSTPVTQIQWLCKEPADVDTDEGSVTTARIDHAVTVLVPLAIAGSSTILAAMDRHLQGVEDQDICPPPAALQLSIDQIPRIEVSLTTRKGRTGVSWDAKGEADVLAPSRAPLVATEKDIEDSCDANVGPSEIRLKREIIEVLKNYQLRKDEIKSWTVTQDSVRVSTTRYSSVALAVAFGVISGSLPLPFVIGDKLPGVDPFQLVMFSWLMVGAFLVGAKSRYVENWPWHDFLRMQVVCRSVSELAEAARVDKQAVLLHLLHHEYRHPLVFSGPYPGVFQRQDVSGGFNVDVPTRHATILAAGFIVTETLERVRHADKWERHTVLQDTREGKDGEQLVFQADELSGEVEGKRRLVRTEGDAEDRYIGNNLKVIGLSTADYNFT